MTDSYLVVFFGIGRGGNIAKLYYQKKFRSGCRVMHCYIDQQFVCNTRSGENFNVKEVRELLSPDTIRITEAEVNNFLSSIPSGSLQDSYGDELASVTNLLKQIYMC